MRRYGRPKVGDVAAASLCRVLLVNGGAAYSAGTVSREKAGTNHRPATPATLGSLLSASAQPVLYISRSSSTSRMMQGKLVSRPTG
jgi:hypothetical protein